MSFDAIAPHYRWLERITAGTLLQRCRTRFIAELVDSRNILLIGEGRGRFLHELLRVNSEARITCVDASTRMLELTRSELRTLGRSDRPRLSSSKPTSEHEDERRGRISGSTHPLTNRVRFVHADILNEDWGCSSERFDAVASHFLLDCFQPDQLVHICSMVTARTVSGAPWLLSDFCVPENGWQRIRARWILWSLYRFFRLTTRLTASALTPPDPLLEAAGFRLKQRLYFNHGLLHSDVWVKAQPRSARRAGGVSPSETLHSAV